MDVFLISWKIFDQLTYLYYSDGTSFSIKTVDFHRAFGTIINAPVSDVMRDFLFVEA